VVGGVVIAESETRTRAIDVDTDAVLWESPQAIRGERFVVGDGALVVFDRDLGSISQLDPRRGEAVWIADVGTPPGVQVAAIGDSLLVTSSTTLFTFDAATGEPHGWTALVPERAATVGGTHPPYAER
jgi:outer membrane protein assembly factor BamB